MRGPQDPEFLGGYGKSTLGAQEHVEGFPSAFDLAETQKRRPVVLAIIREAIGRGHAGGLLASVRGSPKMGASGKKTVRFL